MKLSLLKPFLMTSLYLSAAVVFLLFPVTGAEAVPLKSHEKEIMEKFTLGDQKGLYDSLESMIIEHPMDPVSVLYYRSYFDMADTFGNTRIEKTAAAIKNILVKNQEKHAGSCLLQLNCELERIRYRVNGAQGKEITDLLKPVRKWIVFGPYRRYGFGDMNYAFKPELQVSRRDLYPQKRITVTENDGWLDVGKYCYPDHGVVYAATSFIPQGPVLIRIYSEAAFTLSINGRDVLRNSLHEQCNMRMVRVHNNRGITVMVKMRGSPFRKIRMIITDEDNTVIDPQIVMDDIFMDECEITEEQEYPFDIIRKEADAGSDSGTNHCGLFFSNLANVKAVDWYRKSVALRKNCINSYFLADALIDASGGDKGSSAYNEGLRILKGLSDTDRHFIPARQRNVEHLISVKDYPGAYREARDLVRQAPSLPDAFGLLLKVLSHLQYEHEFEQIAASAKKQFPESENILEEEADYYAAHDRNKYVTLTGNLMKMHFSVSRCRSLIREYAARGDYMAALECINEYNFNNDFNKEQVEVHIKMGDLPGAREMILKTILVSESPYLYYGLGVIDMLQSEDPSMYFQKLLNLQPSEFSLSDYVQYLERNELVNPFSQYMDRVMEIGASSFTKEDGRAAATVLYRGRIFLLHDDGSSRVYCEDIIHIGNDAGVATWGDIKIPFRGRVSPVRLRVYDGKGRVADTYTIQKIRNDTYISINSLTRNSILHLAYIVDNPIQTPAGSRLFSLPLEYIQDYDEAVHKASIKVIAPAGMKVNFYFKSAIPVKKTSVEGMQQYEAVIENIPAARKEKFSAGKQNCLYYYSFSTMNGFADFAAWYLGLLEGKLRGDSLPAQTFRKDTLEKTIADVYNFVAREIELERPVLYAPESAVNTYFRKRGTAEDKVVLARALLDRLGIRSYIAFARNRFLPQAGTFMFPEYFTAVLLCVPLDVNTALWLDFSDRYFRCGVTAATVAGANAVVMINNTYRIREVRSRDNGSMISTIAVVLGDDGSATYDAEISLTGTLGTIRHLFRNRQYQEEAVHRYMSGFLPGFTMEQYHVDHYKECDLTFTIAARGTGVGAARIDSGSLMIQPVLHKCGIHEYISVPRRTQPLVVERPIHEKETYHYTLPQQFAGNEISRNHIVKSRFGNCRIIITKKTGSPVLIVEKEIHIDPMTIRPIEYNDFMNFCLELQRIENDAVLLKK